MEEAGVEPRDADETDKEGNDSSIAISDDQMEVDTPNRSQTEVVLFGGSNCENMDHHLKGDEQIEVKTCVFFEGGLKIEGIKNKLDELGDQRKKEDTKLIVLHAGSADFPYEALKRSTLYYFVGFI